MAGEVDLLFQVGEGLGDCLDLIDITRGVEGLAVGDGGGVPGFLRELLCAFGDQQRHRIASQSGAGIIKEPGDQGFRCSAVDGQHQVEGESAGLRSLGPVREEGLQIGEGKGLLFSEFTFHDHFHGRAQPVASDPVAGLDGTEERQQGGGPGLGEGSEGHRGLRISRPLGSHRLDGGDLLLQIGGQFGLGVLQRSEHENKPGQTGRKGSGNHDGRILAGSGHDSSMGWLPRNPGRHLFFKWSRVTGWSPPHRQHTSRAGRRRRRK